MKTFQETQSLDNTLKIVFAAGVGITNIVALVICYLQDISVFYPLLWVLIPVMLISLGIMFGFKLETEIDSTSVRVRVKPFHRRFKEFRWEDIRVAYVRQYKPIGEYGGWGLRRGMEGRAYNARGNMGLQLVLNNGTKILIGTSKAEELKHWLQQREESKKVY